MLTTKLILISFAFYAYFIYPILLVSLSCFKRAPPNKDKTFEPFVSLIVPVYNGENLIPKKIENLAQINYPEHKMEIIFISDGSVDETNNLLLSCAKIKPIILTERVGKERAVQKAIERANGSIICLSDVGTMINSDSIKHMAQHFQDTDVGAVSSLDRPSFKEFILETFHVNFENKIRLLESKISSCVGVSGSFFMARKELLSVISNEGCSDLAIAFECVKNNYRVAIESKSFGSYGKSDSISNEYGRKVRTINHGLKTVSAYSCLLNPLKYSWFSWQLISHKLFRWLSPISISLFLLILAVEYIAQVSLLEMVSLFALLLTLLLIPIPRKYITKNVGLLCIYNLAILNSIVDVIRKKDYKIWEPTKRS